jgi:hypothetical protein
MFSRYTPDKTEDPTMSDEEPDIEMPIRREPNKHRSFTDVMNTMNTKFSYQDGKLSTALDVVSWYLKGQKMIYLEAQSYCEFYLYRLMIPAIFISTLTTVISGIFTGNVLASNIVSGATALNTIILSLINYFKLDAKSEAHKMTAYSFDQLISECEFTSGKILLSNVKPTDPQFFQDYICKIEAKIKEIKEKNQFIIPATIRDRYPTVCNRNIFMDVENQLLLTPLDDELADQKRKIYKLRNEKICIIMNDRIDDTNYSKCVLQELETQRSRKNWLVY